WIDPIDLVSRTDHPFMGANVVIHIIGDTPSMSPEQIRELLDKWNEENAGSGTTVTIRHAGHEYSSQPCMAAVDEPDATVKEVIHLMEMGSVLCRSPEYRSDPWTWPVGHTWVKRADAECVTCPEC